MAFKSDTTEQFIEKAKLVHSDKYDYSKVKYIKNKQEVEIICSIHGEFLQKPSSHKQGHNCPKCASIARYEKTRYSKQELIEKFNKIHNNKFSYILDHYENTNQVIDIICPKHGIFPQRVDSHLSGAQCYKCSIENKIKPCDEHLIDFNTVHGNLYTYSEFYDDGTVDIVCPKHGFFNRSINNHKNGQRCPKCLNIVSKPEIIIQEFVKSLGYEIFSNTRKVIFPKELDIYIPELNKAIEFNGKYWHYSEKHFVPGKHAIKSNICREKGIKLLHIREDLWLRDKKKVLEIVKIFVNKKDS